MTLRIDDTTIEPSRDAIADPVFGFRALIPLWLHLTWLATFAALMAGILVVGSYADGFPVDVAVQLAVIVWWATLLTDLASVAWCLVIDTSPRLVLVMTSTIRGFCCVGLLGLMTETVFRDELLSMLS